MKLLRKLVSLLGHLVTGHSSRRRKKRRGRKIKRTARKTKRDRLGRAISSRRVSRRIKEPRRKKPVSRPGRKKVLSPRKKSTPSKIASGNKRRLPTKKKAIAPKDRQGVQRPAFVHPEKVPVRNKDLNDKGLFVGDITHYFSKIMVCVLAVKGCPLTVGQKIRIQGKANRFVQDVKSLQVESVDVRQAKKGQLVGLKVDQPVKEGDRVYLI